MTKYGRFIPMSSGFTSQFVAQAFVKEIVCLHGTPMSILSNRDRTFLSNFWSELLRLHRTTLAMSTAYHPNSDGQTEVLNKFLELYLRCFVADEPRRWVHFLPWTEFWHNMTYQTSAGMTPFGAVYGRLPPTLSWYLPSSTTDPEVHNALLARDQILSELKLNLSRAQNQMKMQADRHHSDRSFLEGQLVFMKL